MLTTVAMSNYRSIVDLVIPLGRLNVISGANGVGKSNIYRALRLLAETAHSGVTQALARGGGIIIHFLGRAGPERLSPAMQAAHVPVQGGPRQSPQRLRLGFASEQYSYSISLGLPPADATSLFSLDPQIKQESIWAGCLYRPGSQLVARQNALLKLRNGRSWQVDSSRLSVFDSLFDYPVDPQHAPEILQVRELIRSWRFYDQLRTDTGAAARSAQLGCRTPVLSDTGADLAAALQTIYEIGDRERLVQAIDDAFPGAKVMIQSQPDGRFLLLFEQPGLLRPLTAADRVVRWHLALFAAGGGPANAAATRHAGVK